MFTTQTNTAKAFTLIEIMIVIVIIGILAVALFPKLLGAIGKSSDEARKADLKSLSVILLQYKNDHQGVMANDDGVPWGAQCLTPTDGLGEELIATGYVALGKFPKDPVKSSVVSMCSGSNSGYFHYKPLKAFGNANSAFMVVARMENTAKGNSGSDSIPSNDEASTFSLGSSGRYYVEVGGL